MEQQVFTLERKREKLEKKLWKWGRIDCFGMLNLEELDDRHNENIGF